MNDDTSSAVHTEKRRLAAIMFTDMVGFSHQMGTNEAYTLRLLAIHNQIIEHAVAAHQGHVIKTAGDGFLIEFPSIVPPSSAHRRFKPNSILTILTKS